MRSPQQFGALAFVLFVCLILLFDHYSPTRLPGRPHLSAPHLPGHGINQKLAYATFFSTRAESDTENDPYFTAARVLTYQLLHHPETKTQQNIPLLILVPPHVSQHKREVLQAEGAIIVPVKLVEAKNDWIFRKGGVEPRWVDQFAKLRLFEQTEYDRILYMDTDMLITKCLDDIFKEPITQSLQYTKNITSEIKEDEGELPPTYLFTGVSDTGGSEHDTPPTEGKDLNGGFWMTRPDKDLFAYYMRVLEQSDRFPPQFMEQALLLYAHRKDGNMPWQAFEMGKWNVNWPTEKDVKHGTATLHDKFWDPANKDWIDRSLVQNWWRMQGMMEGYWQRAAQSKGYGRIGRRW